VSRKKNKKFSNIELNSQPFLEKTKKNKIDGKKRQTSKTKAIVSMGDQDFSQ
jgi:hypothetical protein